jgi:hypothetical protein
MRLLKVLRALLWLLLLFASGLGGWRVARPRNDGGVLKVPGEVVARPGRIALIPAEAPARVVWHTCPGSPAPDVLPLDDGHTLVFVGGPGRYELIAWSAAGGQPTEAAKCVVRVEPEAPPDRLGEKLRAAWAKESSPQRDRQRELLAGLYEAAGETVKQPTLRTLGDVYAALRNAAGTLMPADALPALRAAIADELRSALPADPDVVLDDALRSKGADAFRRIAAALNQV